MDSRFRPARIVEAVATSPMRERGAEIRAFPFSSVAVSGRCEWESPAGHHDRDGAGRLVLTGRRRLARIVTAPAISG